VTAKFDFFVTRAFALFDDEGLVILFDSYPYFGVTDDNNASSSHRKARRIAIN
jgi:hypothetical protein